MAAPLRGGACPSCGDLFYPLRPTCPRCGQVLSERDMSGKGDVYSYTVVGGQTDGGDGEPPRIVALVHLAEGAYVTARLAAVAPEALFIGLPVELADGEDLPTFRPRRSLVE